jgi:hypothetical protein
MSLATVEQKIGSFLKAAEQGVKVVLDGAAKAEPVAVVAADAVATAAGYPEVCLAIQKIGAIVVGAGALVDNASNGSGSGADKLAVAAPQVETLIKSSGFLGTTAVADVSKWDAAIKAITGAFADLFDSLEAKSAAK